MATPGGSRAGSRLGSRWALSGLRDMDASLNQLAAFVRLRQQTAVWAEKIQAINLSLVEYYGYGASRPRWCRHGRSK
jgi:hypothetical protein